MRLVLAHSHDVAARELADRWGDDAVLLTPAELSAERLLLHLDTQGEARAQVASRPEVTSVLTRLGGIGPADLVQVDAQDASYAAAELDAFLRAWLGAWPGPVVNRPSTTCLNGPGWRREQWAVAAAAVGLPVRPVHRHATPGGAPDSGPLESAARTWVTAIGDRWFGSGRADLGHKLCTLAESVGCVALEAMFIDDVVAEISPWPNVAAPEVADTLALMMDGMQ
ncbi:hypothetical protein AB0E63_24130 [Kribbella sp. NPDC026596]|uniref:hypothetical protein n=1 Tax=Kribbella sp. NPDC026596 TaxID=3155122 RepID=UPI0033FF5682